MQSGNSLRIFLPLARQIRRILPGLLLCFFTLSFSLLHAQPLITWDHTYGANGYETLGGLAETTDGNYIFAGVTTSGVANDVTQVSRGSSDFWLVKLRCIRLFRRYLIVWWTPWPWYRMFVWLLICQQCRPSSLCLLLRWFRSRFLIREWSWNQKHGWDRGRPFSLASTFKYRSCNIIISLIFPSFFHEQKIKTIENSFIFKTQWNIFKSL